MEEDGPKICVFDLPFPPEMTQSEEKSKNPLGYPDMSKSRFYLFPPLRGNAIAFCATWAIFGSKQGGVTNQRVRTYDISPTWFLVNFL